MNECCLKKWLCWLRWRLMATSWLWRVVVVWIERQTYISDFGPLLPTLQLTKSSFWISDETFGFYSRQLTFTSLQTNHVTDSFWSSSSASLGPPHPVSPPPPWGNAFWLMFALCSLTIKVHITTFLAGHRALGNLSPYHWAMVTHIWLMIQLFLIPFGLRTRFYLNNVFKLLYCLFAFIF